MTTLDAESVWGLGTEVRFFEMIQSQFLGFIRSLSVAALLGFLAATVFAGSAAAHVESAATALNGQQMQSADAETQQAERARGV
ncbi:hypothetical protein [Pacificispira sp.]|uniref:hypothetical protein n=1 Tax=Pacificispira sp. TaxID=2888761 RepID=UPI003BA9B840